MAEPVLVDVAPFEKHLEFTVTQSEIDKAKNRVARKISREVKIRGFRPGKAPLPVVERTVGSERIERDALTDAVQKALPEVIEQIGLDKVLSISALSFDPDDDGVLVKMTVNLQPVLEKIPPYQDQEVVLNLSEPTEEELEQFLEEYIRQQYGYLALVDEPAAVGNVISIDMWRMEDGNRVEPPLVVEQMYEIGGRGNENPELDEQLIGMVAGETKRFGTSITETHTHNVEVTVHDVRTIEVPEVTDEWVSEETRFERVAELEEFIREQVEILNKQQLLEELAHLSLMQVLDQVDLEIPEALVVEEKERKFEWLKNRLTQTGHTIEQYIEQTQTDAEGLEQELHMHSVRELRKRYLLEAVAKEEEVEFTMEEVEIFYGHLKEREGEQSEMPPFDQVSKQSALNLMGIMMMGAAERIIAEAAIPVDQEGNPLDLSVPEPFERPLSSKITTVVEADTEDSTEDDVTGEVVEAEIVE